MVVIHSLQEFLVKIGEKFKELGDCEDMVDKYIYRGQADRDWPISSSACRFFSRTYPILDLTVELLRKYVERQNEVIRKFTNEPNPQWSLRHFGGNTPYLDFSRNCLIALYFACEELQGLKDGAVYIVKMCEDGSASEIGRLVEINYGDNQAISRVKAQSALLIEPSEVQVDKCVLTEWIIDKNAKEDIICQLEQLHICRTTIYPDLMEYIRYQGQYTDVFKDEILRKIEESPDFYYQKYPDIITSLQNLLNNKRISNNERKMAYCQLIKYYLYYKRPEKALEILDETYLKESKITEDMGDHIIYRYEGTVRLLICSYMRGRCYLSQGMYRRAYQELSDAIKEIDWNNKREYWEEKKLSDEVQENLRLIHNEIAYPKIKLNPEELTGVLETLQYENLIDLKKKQAGLLYESGRYEEALKEIEEISPSDDVVYDLRARCHLQMYRNKNPRLALKRIRNLFKEAINLDPNCTNVGYRYNLALSYVGWKEEDIDDFDSAIAVFDELSKNEWYCEEAMHEAAKYVHIKAKSKGKLDFQMLDEAVSKYIEAIKKRKNENNAMNFVDLAEVLSDIYRFEKAHPESAVEIDNIKRRYLDKIKTLEGFRECGQTEVQKLWNIIRDIEFKDANSMLLMNMYLLQIVVAIYPEDEYGFNKLGKVYEELWKVNKDSRYADKAIDAYNSARYYFVRKGLYYNEEEKEASYYLTNLNKKIHSIIKKRYKEEKNRPIK